MEPKSFVCVQANHETEYLFLHKSIRTPFDPQVSKWTPAIFDAAFMPYDDVFRYCRDAANAAHGIVGMFPCPYKIFQPFVRDVVDIRKIVHLIEFAFYVKYADLFCVGGAYMYQPKITVVENTAFSLLKLPDRFSFYVQPNANTYSPVTTVATYDIDHKNDVKTAYVELDLVRVFLPGIEDMVSMFEHVGHYLRNQDTWTYPYDPHKQNVIPLQQERVVHEVHRSLFL